MAGRFKNTLQPLAACRIRRSGARSRADRALAAAAAYGTWVLLAPAAKAAPALGEQARALEAPSPAARRLFGAGARRKPLLPGRCA
jgi:hypothetical protein